MKDNSPQPFSPKFRYRHISRRWGHGFWAVMTLWAVSVVPVTKFSPFTSSHIKQWQNHRISGFLSPVAMWKPNLLVRNLDFIQTLTPSSCSDKSGVAYIFLFAWQGLLRMVGNVSPLPKLTFVIVQPFQKRQGSPQGWRKLQKWMDLFSVKTVTAMVP